MFHLWTGVMAGILLAYVWTHSPNRLREAKAQWWLAVAGTLVLLVPVAWDLWRTSVTYFGPIESLKSVLLPWVAGFGFGIWAFLIAPQAAPTSWIPLMVALLFVAVIVSEERYGWLGRLQKITFGGGGVEFATAPASDRLAVDTSPLQVSGAPTGEGRIGDLVEFMADLPSMIQRDQSYARELGFGSGYAVDAKHDEFARDIIAPLGGVLRRIHDVRGYNDIAFLIDRPFVESFRGLIRGYLIPIPPADSASSAMKTFVGNVQGVWLRACDIEFQLRRSKHIASASGDDLKDRDACIAAAKKALHAFQEDPARIAPNQALPYGTLLLAMLLNAAGEVDMAVEDLERWVAGNPPKDAQDPQWIAVYRTRYLIANLLTQDNPSGVRMYLTIQQYKKLLEIGERFLASTFPSNKLSWRTQLDRLDNGDRIDSIWNTAICALDLSSNFKRLMMVHLTAANNFSYFLSQNIDFAKHENLRDEMEKRARYLAAVDLHCLQDDPYSDEQKKAANRSRATFLDTAAAVETALALQEDLRGEKRTRLCRALRHLQHAGNLYNEAIKKTGKVQSEQERLEETETKLTLLRRQERVQRHLSNAGMDC